MCGCAHGALQRLREVADMGRSLCCDRAQCKAEGAMCQAVAHPWTISEHRGQLWLSRRCQSGLSSCSKGSIASVSCMPLGCVPCGGDKPLGREISPALHLTVLLLATVELWKLPGSPTLLPPQWFLRPSGASHQGVPQSCHEQRLLCGGLGVENQLSGFPDFVNRRK